MTSNRLVLVLGLAALWACDEPTPAAAPSGRVVAVSGRAAQGPESSGRSRWVNVWATWCKPCVEEMPRLLAWQKRLTEAGTPIDLVFVSVDASADAIAQFRAQHPDMPESLHVANAEGFSAWLPTVGLADGSPIPMHIYADRRGHQRCIRAGAVAEADYQFVQVLTQRHP
jgi:thiol-disulfide isomerase/thioredoxin